MKDLLSLTDKEADELEQLLIDVVYSESAPPRDYDKSLLFEVLSKLEESGKYEVEPRCDICDRLQNDSPNVFDYGETTENDWNGETGNHLGCENLLNKGSGFIYNRTLKRWE